MYGSADRALTNERDFPVLSKRRGSRTASKCQDGLATVHQQSRRGSPWLPNLVRLHIEGVGAEYMPYRGPAIDSWTGTTELAPGKSTTVVFRDAADKRGVWRLPPGDYRISARYHVPPELAAPPTVSHRERVWRGMVRSAPVAMTVLGSRR
jgi:hypothetical protein